MILRVCTGFLGPTVSYLQSIALPNVGCFSFALPTVGCLQSIALPTVSYLQSIALPTVGYLQSIALPTVGCLQSVALPTVGCLQSLALNLLQGWKCIIVITLVADIVILIPRIHWFDGFTHRNFVTCASCGVIRASCGVWRYLHFLERPQHRE